MFSMVPVFGPLWALLKYLLVAIWLEPSPISKLDKGGDGSASTYDEWYALQSELDAIRGVDDWVADDRDTHYDWHILRTLKRDLERCRRHGDVRGLCSQLRAQSSRNMCRVLSPALYRKSPIQTKRLIHDYVLEVRRCIIFMANRNAMLNPTTVVVSAQEKRQALYDMRKTLGRTGLVLQGGATISMCHLGVVKTLYLQHLLPQIVIGTATGALIAALVGATTDDRLLEVLTGNSINLDAFVRGRARRKDRRQNSWYQPAWFATFQRRYRRYRTTKHLFDIDVLQECARDNLGDLTFEEAYARTGRILNITVAMSEVSGTAQLLNYITAPHVLIWSAVMASIATSKEMYAPVQLLCKNDTGAITRYFAADFFDGLSHHQTSSIRHEAPLQRIGELFNVNHFIVSQTRPYIAPFIRLQRAADHHPPLGTLVRLVLSEVLHWLETLNRLDFLPTFLQRILVDEVVPSFTPWSKLSITPQLEWRDVFAMFDTPTATELRKWATRGEKSTWPFICELKVRCDIEIELDTACINMHRRTPGLAEG